MIQVKESELDACLGMMDDVCAGWQFEMLRRRVIDLLDVG